MEFKEGLLVPRQGGAGESKPEAAHGDQRTHRGLDGLHDMSYAVDNKDVLSRVKLGDQIAAKVYDGDSTLYEQDEQAWAAVGGLGTNGFGYQSSSRGFLVLYLLLRIWQDAVITA